MAGIFDEASGFDDGNYADIAPPSIVLIMWLNYGFFAPLPVRPLVHQRANEPGGEQARGRTGKGAKKPDTMWFRFYLLQVYISQSLSLSVKTEILFVLILYTLWGISDIHMMMFVQCLVLCNIKYYVICININYLLLSHSQDMNIQW